MQIDKIHPQLQGVFKRIPSIPFHNRLFLACMNALTKLAPRAKRMPGIVISEHQVNNCRLRIYQPEGESSGAAMLWMHGGGMITGYCEMTDKECAAYARELKLVVVSVNYRLAPKHPFPAALNDCHDAWHWLQASAQGFDIDPKRIVVSGHSAGACLAASLSQQLHDQGGVQPAAQALFYPMVDDRTAVHKHLDNIKHCLWNNTNNRAAWHWYLGQPAGEIKTEQYAVPARRDDLSGLPTTWMGTGDIDLFHQEDCEYANRLNKAGVSCQLDIVPMAPHAFEVTVPNAEISQDFMASNYAFLRQALSL